MSEANVQVQIVRFVEEHQPNIVECRLTDAWGWDWVFIDKCAVFTDQSLDAASPYPMPGVIACEIIKREQDTQGRQIITVDTELPYHIEATGGETRFDVLAQQLSSPTVA